MTEAAFLIVGLLLGAGLITPGMVSALRGERRARVEAESNREAAEARLFLRVAELENRLMSHGWQDYAQLQTLPSAATTPPIKTNSWGEERSEESYGESEEDVIEAYLAQHGVSLEGPTVG